MSVVSLLIVVVVFCFVVWAVRSLFAAFGVGEPIATIVWVVLVFLFIVWLIGAVGGGAGELRLPRL
jgi:hypothetical protein